MFETEVFVVYFDWNERQARIVSRSEEPLEPDRIVDRQVANKSYVRKTFKLQEAKGIAANINASLGWEVRCSTDGHCVVVPTYVPSGRSAQLLSLHTKDVGVRRPILKDQESLKLKMRVDTFSTALNVCRAQSLVS